jgi:hypothetical protein
MLKREFGYPGNFEWVSCLEMAEIHTVETNVQFIFVSDDGS